MVQFEIPMIGAPSHSDPGNGGDGNGLGNTLVANPEDTSPVSF